MWIIYHIYIYNSNWVFRLRQGASVCSRMCPRVAFTNNVHRPFSVCTDSKAFIRTQNPRRLQSGTEQRSCNRYRSVCFLVVTSKHWGNFWRGIEPVVTHHSIAAKMPWLSRLAVHFSDACISAVPFSTIWMALKLVSWIVPRFPARFGTKLEGLPDMSLWLAIWTRTPYLQAFILAASEIVTWCMMLCAHIVVYGTFSIPSHMHFTHTYIICI